MAANLPVPAMIEGPGQQVRWQELTKSECFELLSEERLGRIRIQNGCRKTSQACVIGRIPRHFTLP